MTKRKVRRPKLIAAATLATPALARQSDVTSRHLRTERRCERFFHCPLYQWPRLHSSAARRRIRYRTVGWGQRPLRACVV